MVTYYVPASELCLTAAQIREIAVAVTAHPRTVAREVAHRGCVRGDVGRRIREELERRGVPERAK